MTESIALPPSDDLRYPIGPFDLSAAPTAPGGRATQIQTLSELPGGLRAAVDGLDAPQLDTPYRDGGWTARQVVHHVADSHANASMRFKLALTEDWPTIKPYREAAWAGLADSRLSVEPSLQLISGLHQRWVALLESLDEADLQRGYVHPELGRVTLAAALELYAWHSRHHTAHILSLRRRHGW